MINRILSMYILEEMSLVYRISGSNVIHEVLEYVFRPMRLRPMWPMYGTYIATLLGLALIKRITFLNMVSILFL
jgi:hypothetical protein